MSSLCVGIYLVVYLILLRLPDRGLENPVLLTGSFIAPSGGQVAKHEHSQNH